jgi:flagellar hook-associated protein 1 FlgK
MSLVTLLSIARTALLTHQRAMDVTAHNVANAQTPGYSRQRLTLGAAAPLLMPDGTMGRGVTAAGIERARDRFHDASYRQESGLLGRSATLADMLGQVEAAMGEPSDGGVAAALDGFFTAFADLAGNPTGTTGRTQARAAAARLVERLRTLDGAIARTAASALEQLREQVAQVNAIGRRVAELNAAILASGGPDHLAADLQDQRDLLIDQLSGLVGVRVTLHDDGTVAVSAGDAVLVDRGSAQTLEVLDLGGGTYGIGVAGVAARVDPRGGSVGGLLETLNTRLGSIRARLDEIARALVTEVNALHRTGFTPGGASGTDLFDPAGVTAGSIALTAAVLASPDAIAAGATAAPGDGTVAQRIAALASQGLAALGGRTLRDAYVNLAASVGGEVRAAAQDAGTYAALADRSDALRQSVSGVSLDEEMVVLIGQQQAYSAAARLIRIADDMMQDLLRMI